MLRAQEIEQRFTQIQQAIGQATKTCKAETGVSPQLKHCIEELDKQSAMAASVVQSMDENRIRDCVDELENLGDEAKRACSTDIGAPTQLKDEVARVHDQLSRLKHQIH